MKKIVFVSYSKSSQFTNPEEWLIRIRAYTGVPERLAEKHEVTSIEQISYKGEYRQNGVLYYFNNANKVNFYLPWALHHYIKNLQPLVIIVHGLIFPLQVIQLRASVGKDVKILVQNHAEKPASGYLKVLQKLADRFINAYLFTSKEMGAEWITKKIIADPSKIQGVMEASSSFYPMDKELARSKTFVTGEPSFLWVGRLDSNKNPLSVIHAFIEFRRSTPRAKLYMIYHTEELIGEIKQTLENHHATDGILLCGNQSHDQMLYWFNSADFIVSGSYYEGSGVAICEAMSCGCIPIVTDIPAFRKLTGNGACGFLYEAGDSNALLSLFLKIPGLDLGNERQQVIHQFRSVLSFEAIADRMEEVINSL